MANLVGPVIAYGYLTVAVDMAGDAKRLMIAFNSPQVHRNYDRVVVGLVTRHVIAAP